MVKFSDRLKDLIISNLFNLQIEWFQPSVQLMFYLSWKVLLTTWDSQKMIYGKVKVWTLIIKWIHIPSVLKKTFKFLTRNLLKENLINISWEYSMNDIKQFWTILWPHIFIITLFLINYIVTKSLTSSLKITTSYMDDSLKLQ